MHIYECFHKTRIFTKYHHANIQLQELWNAVSPFSICSSFIFIVYCQVPTMTTSEQHLKYLKASLGIS